MNYRERSVSGLSPVSSGGLVRDVVNLDRHTPLAGPHVQPCRAVSSASYFTSCSPRTSQDKTSLQRDIGNLRQDERLPANKTAPGSKTGSRRRSFRTQPVQRTKLSITLSGMAWRQAAVFPHDALPPSACSDNLRLCLGQQPCETCPNPNPSLVSATSVVIIFDRA
jgi:hypothetical protein